MKRTKKPSVVTCTNCKHKNYGAAPVGSVEHKLQALEDAMVLRDRLSKEKGRPVYISPFTFDIDAVGVRSPMTLEEASDILREVLDGQSIPKVTAAHDVDEQTIRRLLLPVVLVDTPRLGDKPLSAASRRLAKCGHGPGPCTIKSCYDARFFKRFGVKPAHILV